MAQFEILTRDLMHYVEVTLNNESVRTEAGAVRYWRGQIDMKNPLPSVGGMIKSAMTGEKFFRPVYSGTGKLMLAPKFHEFVAIPLKNERFVIERGAYWASDMGVEVNTQMNNLSAGLLSGEGLIQTAVQGTGTVIACSPGPVEIIDLVNDKLVLDHAYAVARSASLKYSVKLASKGFFATASSGQGLVQTLEGTGRVYFSPVPNHSLVLQELIVNSMSGVLGSFFKKK